MENRVSLIGIIVENSESVEALNRVLHEYSQYIIGRLGLPYDRRQLAVISVVLDAPAEVVSAITGKLGMLDGVSVKSMMARMTK